MQTYPSMQANNVGRIELVSIEFAIINFPSANAERAEYACIIVAGTCKPTNKRLLLAIKRSIIMQSFS